VVNIDSYLQPPMQTINPDRKIHWVSSADPGNKSVLDDLEERMRLFYAENSLYYDAISPHEVSWGDLSNSVYQDILRRAKMADAVLEVGCGSASVLATGQLAQGRYTGVDFSEAQLMKNRQRYPEAAFVPLTNPGKLPFSEKTFDYVFSVFVLEHVVYPQRFLQENLRVLKPGGTFCLLCPNFLGALYMTSQRTGFSDGTGREKLQRGQTWDAFVTGWDNKVRVPFACFTRGLLAKMRPRFYINTRPRCFVDAFNPDVDAVYLTYLPEIKREVGPFLRREQPDPKIQAYTTSNRLLYLCGVKSA
jgi:SAM-dependent methyltransferase